MEWLIAIGLGILGAAMGSFAGATVWRLRARQLKADKADGEKVNAEEYKRLLPLTKVTFTKDRSHCLHCGYVLRWYDLIPVVSWLTLDGKCRKCRHAIGSFELLMELGTAAFFIISYLFWPTPLDGWVAITQLVLWLIAGVGLAILFAYDSKWFLLPDKANFTVMGIAAVSAVFGIATSQHPLQQFESVVISVVILGGLYWLLYEVSRHRWVGFGDVKLGIGLGLLLGNWEVALLALFAANIIGTLIVIPGLVRGKLKSRSHVPFGPLLILGAVVGQLWGAALVDWYLTTVLYIGV